MVRGASELGERFDALRTAEAGLPVPFTGARPPPHEPARAVRGWHLAFVSARKISRPSCVQLVAPEATMHNVRHRCGGASHAPSSPDPQPCPLPSLVQVRWCSQRCLSTAICLT